MVTIIELRVLNIKQYTFIKYHINILSKQKEIQLIINCKPIYIKQSKITITS